MKHAPLALYALVAAGDLVGRFLHSELLDYVFKPLLMPVLAFWYFAHRTKTDSFFDRLVYSALLFSWLGDVFLMLEDKNPLFFICGLGSFLVAHILYIVLYRSPLNASPAESLLKKKPFLAAPFVLIAIVLYAVLFPNLDAVLKTAVPIYAGTIAFMAIFSLNRFGKFSSGSFWKVFAGALLFMFSDSIIAINKFLSPFGAAGFFIMLLYIFGQFLIVDGLRMQGEGK